MMQKKKKAKPLIVATVDFLCKSYTSFLNSKFSRSNVERSNQFQGNIYCIKNTAKPFHSKNFRFHILVCISSLKIHYSLSGTRKSIVGLHMMPKYGKAFHSYNFKFRILILHILVDNLKIQQSLRSGTKQKILIVHYSSYKKKR